MDRKVDLLEGTVTFYIDSVSIASGESYKGKFTVKGTLSPLDIIKADKVYRTLLGKDLQYATSQAQQLAFILSQLSARIVKYPDWWKNEEVGGGHLDESILIDVFDNSVESEKEFREERKRQSEDIKGFLNKELVEGKIEKEE